MVMLLDRSEEFHPPFSKQAYDGVIYGYGGDWK
jgi:hypothetical protein